MAPSKAPYLKNSSTSSYKAAPRLRNIRGQAGILKHKSNQIKTHERNEHQAMSQGQRQPDKAPDEARDEDQHQQRHLQTTTGRMSTYTGRLVQIKTNAAWPCGPRTVRRRRRMELYYQHDNHIPMLRRPRRISISIIIVMIL
jgi:hypothetical protein